MSEGGENPEVGGQRSEVRIQNAKGGRMFKCLRIDDVEPRRHGGTEMEGSKLETSIRNHIFNPAPLGSDVRPQISDFRPLCLGASVVIFPTFPHFRD